MPDIAEDLEALKKVCKRDAHAFSATVDGTNSVCCHCGVAVSSAMASAYHLGVLAGIREEFSH